MKTFTMNTDQIPRDTQLLKTLQDQGANVGITDIVHWVQWKDEGYIDESYPLKAKIEQKVYNFENWDVDGWASDVKEDLVYSRKHDL